MSEYSVSEIASEWRNISDEAQRCMVTRPLMKEHTEKDVNEKWIRGWSTADDTEKDIKWYLYPLIENGIFLHKNGRNCPITMQELLKMHHHYPILNAYYSWLMPDAHISLHQMEEVKNHMVILIGLVTPRGTSFMVSRSNYEHQEGKIILYDDVDLTEEYNYSKESLLVLYIKADNRLRVNKKWF